ncbi:MAG TPA: ABC transporter permease [Candidatus Angelobacter sp.]|nr:ABC transporter permease [Candidatus Angelobacter sp.]
MDDKHQSSASVDLREEAGGALTIALHGLLDARSTGRCWRDLEEKLRRRRVKSVVVDAGDASFSGSIGIALVSHLQSGGMTPGAKVDVRGLKDEIRKMIEMFPSESAVGAGREPSLLWRIPEEIGELVRSFALDLKEQIAFLGGLFVALPVVLVRPRRMRWREVRRVLEKAGANALPVISIFSWLVGLVLALEAAQPLKHMGAEIFIADMIGFSSLRDTGPLVTAIMLAGRSGSAFAAEIGTMKVNEELDALTTMGLSPMRFLVVQRVVAALLLTPLLTLYAMLMGIIGGVVVLRFMGFPPLMIYHEIVARVGLNDFAVGMFKSLIFGFIIGGIGCMRGLQTKEGPRAVGVSTTRSVVASIMLVIFANTIFSMADYFLNQ